MQQSDAATHSAGITREPGSIQSLSQKISKKGFHALAWREKSGDFHIAQENYAGRVS